MLHVDDDTNDELFRKAADDYFLKEAVPDWDSMYSKIVNAPFPTGNNDKKKQRRKWLFLFFCRLKKMDMGFHSPFRAIFRSTSGPEKAKKKMIPVVHSIMVICPCHCVTPKTALRLFETGNKKYFYYFNGP